MKKKFSKILGVGLTLALLFSLLLTAAPVSADVSQPTVSLVEEEISVAEEYVITFVPSKQLIVTGDTITVRFPDDTGVPLATLVQGTGFTISTSPGWITDPITDITTWETNTGVTASAKADDDDLTVVFTLTVTLGSEQAEGIGEGATVRIKFLEAAGIKNPTEPGTYTLEVKTSEETDYVESEGYDIDAPVVGGFVYVYNPSNILLATFGGRLALNAAQTANHFAGDDYTIVVGPGSYDLNATGIEIYGDGLTFESSDGAEDTIINADLATGRAISIHADDATVDGFTVDDSPNDGIWIFYGTEGVTVKNNIITDAAQSGIVLMYDWDSEPLLVVTEATVSGNVIEDSGCGINLYGSAKDNTISDNTITGSSNEGIWFAGGGDGNGNGGPTEGNTITGNTITGGESMGIILAESDEDTAFAYFEDNVIEGNTISENEGHGIVIDSTADEITELQILNNYIADNEGDGIWIEDWDVAAGVIKFNTITGNDTSTGDYGIDNDSSVAVDATFNWWGTTVADDIGDMVSGDVTYEPFLTDTAAAVIAGGKAAANASSLDAKDEAGVKVSGVEYEDGTVYNADIISAVKYIANPEGAIDDAIAFYDVYVVLEDGFVIDDVIAKLKFYDSAITTGSTAHFWTGDFWAECSDFEARDGIIYVTISDISLPALDELEETIFAVVAGEVEALLAAPVISAPESGAEDVALKPTLAWGTVADAIGYDFELADNPLFVIPIASLTGDLGRLITPFYAQVTKLDYSAYYYWRVKAVSADAESVWSTGVFMTVAIPEPEAEVWMCSEGLTFDSRAALEAHLATAAAHQPVEPADIVVVPPDIIVPLPAVTPITPAWIYVIIGVGAVLVIGLIVLIVRTRRVA